MTLAPEQIVYAYPHPPFVDITSFEASTAPLFYFITLIGSAKTSFKSNHVGSNTTTLFSTPY